MAKTVGSIRVLLEAQFGSAIAGLLKVEKATGRMASTVNRNVGLVSRNLNALNRTTAGFGKSMASAFIAGVSVQAARQLIDSATKIQNALKVAGLEGENLKKVYDRLFASAQKNGAPLETLAVLYGRAAQQQKELGVTSEDLLKFTDNVAIALRVAGTDAQTASGALLQLGQALGSGTVHAEEFNSVLEGAPTIAQAAAAGIKEAGGSVAKLKQLVVDGKVSSRAFFDGFAAGAETLADKAAKAGTTTSQGMTILYNALTRAAGRFDKSTEASKRFGDMLKHLAEYIDALSFDSMLHGLDAVADKLNAMLGLVQRWGEAFGRATGAENFGAWLAQTKVGQTLGVQSTKLLRDRMSGDVPQADAVVQAWAQRTYGTNVTTQKTGRLPAAPKVEPVTLANYPTTGSGKKGGSGSRRTADDRFAETIQDVRDRTAALKEEQNALGMSFEAQQKRSVALQLEQEALRQVREEARRKGDADWQSVQLSPEQVKAIDEVSDAYAKQADALRQATEAQDLQRDILKGAFSDLRSALSDGKLSWEELGDIALNVLDKIIDKIEDQLIDAILSAGSAASNDPWAGMRTVGGGGGIFGALISGIGSIFSFFDEGGYTGPGAKNKPAGIVHAGEVVFSQDDVKRHGGVRAVEALRKSRVGSIGNVSSVLPGFMSGGIVSRMASVLPGFAGGGAVSGIGSALPLMDPAVFTGSFGGFKECAL